MKCLVGTAQALPGIQVFPCGIVGKSSEVLGRLGPDSQAATDTDVFVEEVGSFGIHHRGGTELDVSLDAIFFEFEVFVSKTQTHGNAEERRGLFFKDKVVAQQSFLLEHQVAEGIAQLSGHDTDTGTRHHITNPVTVVQHTHHTSGCSHTVAGYRPPR